MGSGEGAPSPGEELVAATPQNAQKGPQELEVTKNRPAARPDPKPGLRRAARADPREPLSPGRIFISVTIYLKNDILLHYVSNTMAWPPGKPAANLGLVTITGYRKIVILLQKRLTFGEGDAYRIKRDTAKIVTLLHRFFRSPVMETELSTQQAFLAAASAPEQQPVEQPDESTSEQEQALSPEMLPVPAATVLILEEAAAKGVPLPSIRGIRARIGRGSLGTISDAVKQWKKDRLPKERYIPRGFEEDEVKKLADFVWSLVQPVLMREIGEAESAAQARFDIESSEVAKLREAAEDSLAAGEKKDEYIAQLEARIADQQNRIADLQSKADALQAALAEVRAHLAEEKAARTAAVAEKEQARLAAASATVELQSMKKLLPFLDPKQLDKLSKPTNAQKADADPTDAAPKRESPVVEPTTAADQESTPVTPGKNSQDKEAKPKSRSKSTRAKSKATLPSLPNGTTDSDFEAK